MTNILKSPIYLNIIEVSRNIFKITEKIKKMKGFHKEEELNRATSKVEIFPVKS